MDKVILEFVKDSGKRPEYRVFYSMVVRIGRGYENDLLVSDPHVSSAHCLVRVHENGFSLEDLESLNGTWLIRQMPSEQEQKPVGENNPAKKLLSRKKGILKQRVQGSVRIYSGDIILVGHTKIRFLASGHPVEPAKPIIKPSPFFEEISSVPKAWLIVVSAVILTCAIEHQESYKNLPVSRFLSVAIGLVLTFLIWSGIWSFVGWLIRKKSYFHAHLSWVALFFLSMTLVYPLSDHLGYISSSSMVEMISGSIIFWLFGSALIAGHLMLATMILRRYQIGVAVGVSSAILLFGVMTYFAGRPQFNPQPELYSTLIPPYARLVAGRSIDQFVNKSRTIFDK